MDNTDLLKKALSSNNPEAIKIAIKLANNPLFKFKPRPDNKPLQDEQKSFFEDKWPGIACVLGGNSSGKTFTSAAKVAKFLDETPPPEPNTPFWLLSKTMDICAGTVWAQGLAYFISKESIKNIVWYRQATAEPRQVVLKPHPNGNNYLIDLKSYDMDRQALQAKSIIGWWADEQISISLLSEIIARTRKWNYPGSQVYSLTPLEPDLELEERFHHPELYPTWKFYRMNTRLNKTLSTTYIKQLIENTIEEQQETRLTGAFTRFEGAIYPNFNKEHIVEPFEIPKNWLKVRGLDLGWRHATACVWAAIDPATDSYYIYREYNAPQTSIEDHVAAINDDWEQQLVKGFTYADPAAAQILYEFRLRGLETIPAAKEVQAGIASVRTLLRPGPDGKPRLFIFNNCTQLIGQLRTYVYDSTTGKPKKESDNYLNDVADALRYLVFSHKINKDEKVFNAKINKPVKIDEFQSTEENRRIATIPKVEAIKDKAFSTALNIVKKRRPF